MSRYYKLDGHRAVPCGLEGFCNVFKDDANRVAVDTIGAYTVSTVFLGIDHALDGGPPLLFETLVFGSGLRFDPDGGRCSTWEEAERQHAAMVARVREEGGAP